VTEFAIEVRHYCRNPKCRSKLKSAVSNPREAFCARRPWKSAAASEDHFNLDTTPLQVGGIKEVLLSNLESAGRGVK
jgi:hypothetical protein